MFKVGEQIVAVSGYQDLMIGQDDKGYLYCTCFMYQEKERRFDEGISYKREQERGVDIHWVDVATCGHVSLLKRNFARPLLDKVMKKIEENEKDVMKVWKTFAHAREPSLFPRHALLVTADLLGRIKK